VLCNYENNVTEKGHNKLISGSRVLVEKLIVVQLVNKFPAFATTCYETLS
jgi:hypothetical protein